MTKRDYSSRAQQTTLSGSLTSSATTTTVGSGANLMGGVTPATSTYTAVIDPDTALEEIVDITAVSGNILTITRGIDGSTGVTHSAGAIIRHMVIGRDLREANQHSENSTTAHGLTLANVVKTTDTGTVTSTMLLDGTILNADINASAAIVDTKLDTISTALKVSNSATTAASANTASAIVARDASGNFSAGTITASLTGTASLDLPKSGGTMTGAIEMGTNKITGLGLATAGTDAASKTYVDGVLVSPSNLTGVITSVGTATSIASQTGTGTKFVMDTSPTIATATLTTPTITGAVFNDGSVVFEGTTADAFETTLTVTDPTADRTITFPDATGTVALTSDITSAAVVLVSSQPITSATSISLTSILSATYDNYMVEIDLKGDSAGAQTCLLRFRSGSTDYATSYNWNWIGNNGNNVASQNGTNAGTSIELVGYDSTVGSSVHLMLRQLYKSSTYKKLTWQSYDGDSQVTRNGGGTSTAVSGSYDGFSLIFTAATTGNVRVYGLVNS